MGRRGGAGTVGGRRKQSPIRVRIAEQFAADYEEQLSWLGEGGRFEDQDRLEAAVARAHKRLTRFPFIAPLIRGAIRRLVMPGLPFVIWYSFLDEQRELTLLRLFHQSQRWSEAQDAPRRSDPKS